MKCYTFNGKTLTIEELFNRIKEKLNDPEFEELSSIIYKEKTLEDQLDEFANFSKPFIKNENHEYIGANKFITATHIINGSQTRQLTPQLREETRRAEYIKTYTKHFGSEKAAEEAFNEQIGNEKQNSKVGNYVHEFVNILLEYGDKSKEYANACEKLVKDLKDKDYEFAKSITTNDKYIKYNEIIKIQEKIINMAKNITTWIKKEFPNRKKIYSEMPMFLKADNSTNFDCIDVYGGSNKTISYKGIIGIADLIVLDKDGTVHIVDYKVSGRPYSEWYEAKKNEVDYQLCLYRAMLEHNIDIDPAKVTLHIKPMTMNKSEISSLRSEQEDTGESAIDLLKAKYSGSSRVAVNGAFSSNLREFGIGSKIKIEKINNSQLHNLIEEDWNKIMGYTEDPKILTKEEFIKREYLKPELGSKGEILGWKFFDVIVGKNIQSENKEDFTKENGLIDDYLARLKQNRNDILKTIIQEINEQKKKPTKNFNFLKSDKNPDRKKLLENYLGKYIAKNWDYIGNEIPELAEHGILLFQKTTNQGPIIEAVVLTDVDLNLKININGNQTILGKFYEDDAADKLSIKPLIAVNKNIKGLEVISIINTIVKNYPNSFKNAILNKIVVLNTRGSAAEFINPTDLKDNFNLLCEKAKIENQFINKETGIKVSETYEALMSDLQNIISSLSEDSTLDKLLSSLEENEVTISEKRKTIYNMLREMESKYPQVSAFKDFESKRIYNTSDPVITTYLILGSMFNFLNGQDVIYEGRLSKYGINFDEVWRTLGVPFIKTSSKTNNKGEKPTGFAGGLYVTSPRTTPSTTLQKLNAFYDTTFNSVRKDYLKQANYIESITKNYIKNYHNNFSELISSGNVNVWERLLVHDADGKVNKNLIIKNPWKANDLTDKDIQFLKEILWEINKYRLKGIPDSIKELHYKGNELKIDDLDVVKNAKSDESYFQLPLSRADEFQQRMKINKFGFKNYFLTKLEELRDNHDPRVLHQERIKQIDKLKHTEMYDKYDLTPAQRENLLNSEKNQYNFSFDLDYLAADIAFNSIRKSYFDYALMLTETVIAAMHLKQQEENVDMSSEIQTGSIQSKISLSNKPVIDEDLQDLSKVASELKKINSAIILGLRPLQFLKEITFGQFTNFSRAWAMKYGSNKISYNSILKANKIIWGQQFGKYGSAFVGSGSLADFTMCEAINKLYGIANEDLNRIVYNSTTQRVGIMNNWSKWMYISNSAPDYFNRLTLFIGKMIEDGCFDAHTLDEYGNLIYDWKKDKRFNVLAKKGLNSNDKDPEYIKQKSLYVKMCEEFEKGGEKLITWDSEKKQYIYGDITQAYTPDQRSSIKEVSDMAYGYYDHESKSILNHTFFGLIFLQFQTFLSAKLNLWFKAPSHRGGNTAQGHYVPLKQNGEIMYRRIITDNQGNMIRVDLVPESQLTEEEKGTLLIQEVWEGDYIEGLVYSIGKTLYDIFHLNWKNLSKDKQRLANVKLALHDIILGIIIFNILKYIFSNGTNKLKDINPTERILLRAMRDVSPAALTDLTLNPSFIQTWTNIKNDGINLLFHDNQDVIDIVYKRFGSAKDFIWEEN